MAFGTILRAVAALAFTLALAACIVSPQPLFETDTAVTPLAAGRYEELERGEGSEFTGAGAVTLALDGKTYTLTGDDEREPTVFTLYDLGDGFYAAMAVEDGQAGYAVLRVSGGEVAFWAAVCEEADNLGIVADFPGIQDDGLNCTMPDRATLSAFLTAYAGKAEPDFKYVPEGQ